MDPVIVVLGMLAAVFGIAAFFLFTAKNKAEEEKGRLADENDKLETQVKELSSKKSAPAKAKEKPVKVVKEVVDTGKAERKELQKRVSDQKKEITALRAKSTASEGRIKEITGKIDSSGDAMSLRDELYEARNLAEEMRFRAEQAEKKLATLEKDQPKSEPAPVEEDPVEKGGIDPAELDAIASSHKQELEDKAKAHREQLDGMKNRSKAEVRQAREGAKQEISGLRKKLNQAFREVDQQRRRAENNNKAYRILQLQLDAALEKLALFDPSVQPPGGFYDPEAEKVRREQDAQNKQQAEEEQQQAAAAAALQQAVSDAATETVIAPADATPESTEPAATEPAVTEPAVAAPEVAAEPVAEPAVEEPAVAEPAVAEPAVAEPAVAEPAVAEVAAEPVAETTTVTEPAAEPKEEPKVPALGVSQDTPTLNAVPTVGSNDSQELTDPEAGKISLPDLGEGIGEGGALTFDLDDSSLMDLEEGWSLGSDNTLGDLLSEDKN